MTEAKKLKKAIRARARKTGERYTAARRHVLLARQKRRGPATLPAAPATSAAGPTPAAPRAPARSIGDAAVVKKTGQGLAHWFAALDRFGAAAKGHTASAAHLYETHGVPGWYAQMITVAYERARGLRTTNQTGSGAFQVSVSKTVAATVADVVRAFGDARRRGRWLESADSDLARALEAALARPGAGALAVRKAGYARMRFRWEGTTVEIRVNGKPKGTSTIVADNTNLPGAAAVETRRRQWRAALAALARQLAG
jgi:hypothetical protein